ncbi:MAG: hypothetical protein V1790_01885, partial [Planctomycetota bacterium]
LSMDEALADVAAWDHLKVGPGTFDYDVFGLPAAKTIEGLDRDLCVLRTTHNIADESCLLVGHESTLKCLTLRGRAGGGNPVHLLDFGGAGANEFVNLDNVKIDSPDGQLFRIHAPMKASQCFFDLIGYATYMLGVPTRASTLTNCKLRFTSAAAYTAFQADAGLTLNSVDMESLGAGSVVWVSGTAGAPDVSIVGGSTFGAGAATLLNAAFAGSYRIAGRNMGGKLLASSAAGALLYSRGNTGYPTDAEMVANFTAGTVKCIDFGLARVVTDAAATGVGWETFIRCNRAGTITYTLPLCASMGVPHQLITDSGGNAHRFPIRVVCQGTDTFSDGTTSRTISEQWGNLLLAKNEIAGLPDTWNIPGSSKPNAAMFRGQLLTSGFTEQGSAEPCGGVSLQGRGLLGNITSVGVNTSGIDANGLYFRQSVSGAANDRVYSYTAAPAGPFSGAADWDLVFRFASVLASNDIRQCYGICDITGGAITDVLDGRGGDANDPDHPYALIQKITGAATARLSVRPNTVAGGIAVPTVMNFATWTPAADTWYEARIEKRGNTYKALVYSTTGVLLDQATVTPATVMLATASLKWFSGLKDTTGAAGRDLKQYGSATNQQFSGLGV